MFSAVCRLLVSSGVGRSLCPMPPSLSLSCVKTSALDYLRKVTNAIYINCVKYELYTFPLSLCVCNIKSRGESGEKVQYTVEVGEVEV